MLLLIRFAVILLFIGCIIALPLFLMKLNELEKRKKTEKEMDQRMDSLKKDAEPKKTAPQHSPATVNVQQRFVQIEDKLHALKTDKKWLSVESAHTIGETIPSDYHNYKDAYLKLTNKKQVEQEVLTVLDTMIQDLAMYEEEIEEKKKAALDRQAYIIENREKNDL